MEVWQNTRKFGENAPSVNIPSTGEEWELYTVSMGCSVAARALTGAMKRSLRKFDTLLTKYGEDYREIGPESMAPFYQAAEKYAKYGAYDTEPRYHARRTMQEYADKRGYYIPEVDLW